ncbi:hypothetical protein O3P69_019253 [Scylla paramamosain]|uniref:F5/8 type C domain-containing protein n=1 Tax=Scylla paramamosain TaxID=85552 RepID=A0AAW0SWZ5_SCYPA
MLVTAWTVCDSLDRLSQPGPSVTAWTVCDKVRVEKEGGAWCPRTQVAANSREYLEVDLAGVHVVTASGTQGRFDNGKGLEYTQSYMLEYWRPGLASFRVYTSSHGNQPVRSPGGNEALGFGTLHSRVLEYMM